MKTTKRKTETRYYRSNRGTLKEISMLVLELQSAINEKGIVDAQLFSDDYDLALYLVKEEPMTEDEIAAKEQSAARAKEKRRLAKIGRDTKKILQEAATKEAELKLLAELKKKYEQ